MKRLLKFLYVCFATLLLLSVCSCSSLKVTEEMRNAIDLYLSAVKISETRSAGKVTVTSISDDAAVSFQTTESVIDFVYEVKDGKVIYERVDKLNGNENAKYRCDGITVESYNYDTGTWENKTEENKDFISAETNPLTTLSLFRVDSNMKVRTDYMTDIRSYAEGEYTVVEFTLDDSTVSDILKYYKADGIVRQSAGHKRCYYIDGNGYISKIVVSTVQLFYSNGEEGSYSTEMTVVCE